MLFHLEHEVLFQQHFDALARLRVVSTKNIHALTLDMNIRIRHKVVQVYQISRDIFYSF